MKKNSLQLRLEQGVPAYLVSRGDMPLFADRSYRYAITWRGNTGEDKATELQDIQTTQSNDKNDRKIVRVTGRLGTAIDLQQTFVQPSDGSWLEETLTLTNGSDQTIQITDLQMGFRRSLPASDASRFIAVPFRIQADGKVHDYGVGDLLNGDYSNSGSSSSNGNSVESMLRTEGVPPLADEGRLRSEAWLIQGQEGGLMIAKYNNEHIEMSVAEVEPASGDAPACLRFGGIGLSLYGEPSGATSLVAGASFTFGVTRYEVYCGGISQGYQCYKALLNSHGHGFPPDYNPPINWEELYDVGWYHNDQQKLKRFYTREALMEEARKASEIGCELLYLDPGWEVCEGSSLWDEARLGPVGNFVRTLKQQYGLDVGYRETGSLGSRDAFPPTWYWASNAHADRTRPRHCWDIYYQWRFCACCQPWREEKIRRIREVAKQGMKFMMFDDFVWYGPCYAEDHGHAVPTRPDEHVRAVYGVIEAIRETCPEMLVEAHDPIWPWRERYLPVYFRQGFHGKGSYQENWGFEFMWNSLEDLKNGKARAFYYYALGSDIPLYLHLSMAIDNDRCLFFWWAASTVRHLGIGGKCHNSEDPDLQNMNCSNPEVRWDAYKKEMRLYKTLKPYFVRGAFHGLHEEAHLHTLEGHPGGVLSLFNLSDHPNQIEAVLPAELLQVSPGASLDLSDDVVADWEFEHLRLRVQLPPMSPRVVVIGAAVRLANGVGSIPDSSQNQIRKP